MAGAIYSQSPTYPVHKLTKLSIKLQSFRAGQNLPDKEFRYLRTVIVTAAVHWGFGSMLRLEG